MFFDIGSSPGSRRKRLLERFGWRLGVIDALQHFGITPEIIEHSPWHALYGIHRGVKLVDQPRHLFFRRWTKLEHGGIDITFVAEKMVLGDGIAKYDAQLAEVLRIGDTLLVDVNGGAKWGRS
ncbi:MAG: hypothetical protein Q8P46_03870 [Hyphomicrobiales bacterium]|nr:hypothetical protein [Hyphomicrobiales bacterium]